MRHKLLRYIAFKINPPVCRLDHDYSEIAERCNVQTIKSLHHYHDCLLAYKIENNYLNCEVVTSLFQEGQVNYTLQNFRVLQESTLNSNIGFYSTINWLKRLRNALPGIALYSTSVAAYKNTIRRISTQY